MKKHSHQGRFYVNAVDALLSSFANSNIATGSDVRIGHIEFRAYVDALITHFRNNKNSCWKGIWTLSSVISFIPSALWTDFVLRFASEKRLKVWKAAASASKQSLSRMFPLSNSLEALPKPNIEEALSRMSRNYSRFDLRLAVRTLKVIEQYTL